MLGAVIILSYRLFKKMFCAFQTPFNSSNDLTFCWEFKNFKLIWLDNSNNKIENINENEQ